MARALAGGAGVALTYGFFDATQNATPPDTATVRSGGHATALEGVSRSGDDYTFQMSDPARTPETAAGQPEDPQRQSAFATTTWAAPSVSSPSRRR